MNSIRRRLERLETTAPGLTLRQRRARLLQIIDEAKRRRAEGLPPQPPSPELERRRQRLLALIGRLRAE